MNNLEWCVWHCRFDGSKIEQRNIFELSHNFNRRFESLLQRSKDESMTKEVFGKELDSILMYCYWSKREYEICIADLPWFSEDDLDKTRKQYKRWLSGTKKVDVYDQIKMNWEPFLNYVWGVISE